MIKHLGSRLLDLVCPGFCLICGNSDAGLPICPGCTSRLADLAYPACPDCAAPAAPLKLPCSFCQDHCYPFRQTYALGLYHGLLRDVILAAKRPGGGSLAHGIGQLAGTILFPLQQQQSYSLVTAAPVHWRRQLQRGFNSAELVMHGLRSRLDVPAAKLLSHRRPTKKQAMLPSAQRAANVRGAFRTRGPDLTGQQILLVDDVMTTGETASELSRVLLRAGAGPVQPNLPTKQPRCPHPHCGSCPPCRWARLAVTRLRRPAVGAAGSAPRAQGSGGNTRFSCRCDGAATPCPVR